VASAIRLYRNYDGKNSVFGALAALAQTSDNENTSVYASFNSGGNEIHIIALNKSLTEMVQGSFQVTTSVSISSGQVFGFNQSGAALSEKAAIPSLVGNAFTYTLPPLSAYHFVFKTTTALPSAVRVQNLGKPGMAEAKGGTWPTYLPNGRRQIKQSFPAFFGP
jgi:mannan endo-1,4-beta-mannosidase